MLQSQSANLPQSQSADLPKTDFSTIFKDIKSSFKELFRKNKSELGAILRFLDTVDQSTIVPTIDKVFNAFKFAEIDQIEVVLIGQDPYPGVVSIVHDDSKLHSSSNIEAAGSTLLQGWGLPSNGSRRNIDYAIGLSFSIDARIPESKYPPSLRNIFKCFDRQFGAHPASGDLSFLASRVLMLNAALTTQRGVSNAHAAAYRDFIRKIIIGLSAKKFIVLGGDAKKTVQGLVPENNIYYWGHPSPLSPFNKTETDPRHFVHCDVFTRINAALFSEGKEPINWTNKRAVGQVNLETVATTTSLAINEESLLPVELPAAASVVFDFAVAASVKRILAAVPTQNEPSSNLYPTGNNDASSKATETATALSTPIEECSLLSASTDECSLLSAETAIIIDNNIPIIAEEANIQTTILQAGLPIDVQKAAVQKTIALDLPVEIAAVINAAKIERTPGDARMDLAGRYPTDTVFVFCDGAAQKNGRKNARCSFAAAIYTPAEVITIASEYCVAPSNNRGEIMGFLCGLEFAIRQFNVANYSTLVIISDSEYTIKSVTKWYADWIIKNKLDGKKNLDLISACHKMYIATASTIAMTILHINSHKMRPSGNLAGKFEEFLWIGNDAADHACTSILAAKK